jgi:acyl carrier protein
MSMDRDEVQSRVLSMMAETFELDRDSITLDSKLYEELDLDSIDALDMVVKLQELMNRRVNEEELRGLRTVGDVVDMVVAVTAVQEDHVTPKTTERAG